MERERKKEGKQRGPWNDNRHDEEASGAGENIKTNQLHLEMESLLHSDRHGNSSGKEDEDQEQDLSTVLSNLSKAKNNMDDSSLLQSKALMAQLQRISDLFEEYYYLKIVKLLILCVAFMTVGPALILLNKHILKDLHFNFPMLLSSLGLVTSAIFSSVIVRLGLVKLEHADKIDRKFWIQNIFPVAFCSAATLALGNAAYLYLTVSFLQMLKAFSPVLVLLLAVIFRVDQPTRAVIISVFVICLGTLLASLGEINFNFFGTFIFILASLAEGIKLVITQRVLTNFKYGIVEGLYVFAPAASISLLTFSAVFELSTIYKERAYLIILQNPTTFLAASTMGLLVQFLTFIVIQATSSVTIKVLSTARNALLVLYQVYFQGEIITALQTMGYLVSLGGFGAYNYFRTK